MKRVMRKGQRGVALIMVLIALAIIGAMTAELMESNEVYLATTVNARDAMRAEYLARSGVNLSRLLLSFQRILGKAVNYPFWQYADLMVELFTNDGGGGALTDMVGLDLSGVEGLGLGIEDSDLKVTIIDEDSKLNVNVGDGQTQMPAGKKRLIDQLMALMAPLQYDPIFDRDTGFGPPAKREDIICEIIDWSDADEDLCDGSGGEDPTLYTSLTPPYDRKNAPFDSLEELRLVHGIGDDFWNAFADPSPEEPDKRVLTVWGKGTVNVNTAPAQVLFPLVCMLAIDDSGMNPCLDPAKAVNLATILQAAITIRSLLPFKSAGSFVSAIEAPEQIFLSTPGFPMVNKRLSGQLFSAQSTVFSIYAEAKVGKVRKRIHMVVDMKAEDMLLLDKETSLAMAGGKVLYYRME